MNRRIRMALLSSAIVGICSLAIGFAFLSQALNRENAEPETPPTISATFHTEAGSHAFQLEIADDDQERAKGLMHRRALGQRNGMLFVFPSAPAQLLDAEYLHLAGYHFPRR